MDRTTSVKVNNSRSCSSLVKYGVPQGSVLGPILFSVYCRPLGRIIRKHDIPYHTYADDSQLYVDLRPCDEKTALVNLQRCIQEVREWLRENFLLLNDKNTEVVIFGKDTTEKQLQIGKSVISSRSAATSLGCILDSKLNMSQLSAWPEVRGTADTDGGAYSPFRSSLLVLTHDFIIIQLYGPACGGG